MATQYDTGKSSAKRERAVVRRGRVRCSVMRARCSGQGRVTPAVPLIPPKGSVALAWRGGPGVPGVPGRVPDHVPGFLAAFAAFAAAFISCLCARTFDSDSGPVMSATERNDSSSP